MTSLLLSATVSQVRCAGWNEYYDRVQGCITDDHSPCCCMPVIAEIYTPEPVSKDDLRMIVNGYLGGVCTAAPPLDAVVDFYLAARQLATETLQVGLPHFWQL